MSKSEAQYSAIMRVQAKILFEGIVVFKMSNPYVVGIPDSTYTYKGSTTWVEVKREYNKPTEIQKRIMADLYRENGGRSYFVRVLDKKKPLQWQVRSGHDWECILLHTGTLDNVLNHIVQWRK